jgi:hypothetical protein
MRAEEMARNDAVLSQRRYSRSSRAERGYVGGIGLMREVWTDGLVC